jgi:disulfide bond formation protein DsbB
MNRSPVEATPHLVQDRRAWAMLLAAWLFALAASLGALFIGEVMGQLPCVLCWFQRAFMFPLAVILLVACYRSDLGAVAYALPLAVIGWLIAVGHALLYFGVIPQGLEPCAQGVPCSGEGMTILGGVPLPLLSVGAFTAIAALLFSIRRRAAP